MNDNEREKLVNDLSVINDVRHEEEEIDLELDKTFAGHFTSFEEEKKKGSKLS